MAAEAVVQFVVEKLGDALIQEIILLKGVRQQFERLQKELVSITGFLKTADSKYSNDPDIRIWVSEVRDIAYDVDDVIDAFFLKFVWKEQECSLLRRGVRRARKIIDAHHIGKEIEAIFSRIDDISERRKRYRITDTSSSSTANNEVSLRRTYSHVKDADVVRLEEEIHTLVGELVKEEERRRVITICGMGGLGKTTLAKKVYHHEDVRKKFDFQAWTFISQEFRLNDVLRDILGEVGTFPKEELGKMTDVELVKKLSGFLDENRYLVVLDDIWDVKHWDMLEAAFPRGKSGSKVMLTTRIKAIGEHADPWSLPIEPRLLTADEAWSLICKKVFPEDIVGPSWSVPSELEKCGREMASKCSGLPLAIIVLSGILATKKPVLMAWETVSKDISRGQPGVDAILALSYTGLPYHLKPLFLYLGLFPEDHHISANRLIRMWIAESLISEVQGEEVGRRQLDELIHRCMVQIVERDLSGRVKKCQLHDKMRDLSIAKGREENFFEIVGKAVSTTAASRKLRRCVITIGDGDGDERYVFPQHLIPQIRTVFFVIAGHLPGLNFVYHDFKLVKVLELVGGKFYAPGWELGNIIGKLTNLRYLSLRKTQVELDKSIGNLVSLQTLDLRGTILIRRLPNVIWKMRQLRHLHLGQRPIRNSSLRLRMNTLTKLQTLCHIYAGDWITDLVNFRNLKKLGIRGLTEIKVEKVIDIIVDRLDNLVSLSLEMKQSKGFPNLIKLSHKQNLLSLCLDGKLQSLTSTWPPNITKLILNGSRLKQDPMPTLQMLQNLAHLDMYYAYEGKEMVCSENGFPQLRHLEMRMLPHLEEWRIEKGAMACLTTCEIEWCGSLKMVPQGFQFVTTLQNLSLMEEKNMMELGERVKEGGEDWDVVKHISFVTAKMQNRLG